MMVCHNVTTMNNSSSSSKIGIKIYCDEEKRIITVTTTAICKTRGTRTGTETTIIEILINVEAAIETLTDEAEEINPSDRDAVATWEVMTSTEAHVEDVGAAVVEEEEGETGTAAHTWENTRRTQVLVRAPKPANSCYTYQPSGIELRERTHGRPRLVVQSIDHT